MNPSPYFLKSGLRALLLAAACLCEAKAEILSYRFEGSFTGTGRGNVDLVAALQPVLGSGPVRIDVSFDTSTPATVSPDGQSARASAITGARFSLAGFSGQVGACAVAPPGSCDISVANDYSDLGGPGGYDVYALHPGRFHIGALDDAAGLGTALDLHLELSMFDGLGDALSSLDLDVDLSGLPLRDWRTRLFVSAAGFAGAPGNTEFGIRLDAITRLDAPVVVSEIPEPGTLALLLACGVAALSRQRAARRRGR